VIFPILTLALSGPQIVEIPRQDAPFITVQAVVYVSTMDARDKALARVLNETLLDGTTDFNRYRLLQYGTLAGERMKCTLSPDHFRIQLEVPNGQMLLAAEIMNDVLRNARLDDDDMKATLDRIPYRQSNYWSEALAPWKMDYRIKQPALISFYHQTFVPDSVRIAISGPFQAGDGLAAFQRYVQDWVPPKPARKYLPEPDLFLEKRSSPITTIELQGPHFSIEGGNFAAQLLSATAMGVGKWSAMHRVLREKMGLSYRQEAVITPTPLGFQTHLLFACAPVDGEDGLAENARKALLADVQSWNDQTRARALGMAEGYLLNSAPISPLCLDDNRPLSSSLEDETFLQAYWPMKTGKAWNAAALMEQMRQISLEQLKAAATELLSGAETRVVHGAR